MTVHGTISGEISNWASVNPSPLELKPNGTGVITITIAPPTNATPGNYYGHLTLKAGESTGSALIKVKVLAPMVTSTPGNLEVAIPSGFAGKAAILLTNVGADAENLRSSLVGDIAKFGKVASAPSELRSGTSSELLVEFSTYGVLPGRYAGVAVISAGGMEARTTVSLRVLPPGSPLVQFQFDDKQYLVQAVDAGTTSRVQVTLAEKSGNGELSAIVAQPSPEVSFLSTKLSSNILPSGGTVKGASTVNLPTNIRCGYHFGKLSVRSAGLTYLDAPVVVKAYCPAGHQIVIDGNLNDWANLKVNTVIFGKDDPSIDASADIIVARMTESAGYYLFALNVKGDIDQSHTYGINLDTNADGKADYSLVFSEDRTVILNSVGKLVSALQNATWAYSSGILEAAIDLHELRNIVGATFNLQAFAFANTASSHYETDWVPYRPPL